MKFTENIRQKFFDTIRINRSSINVFIITQKFKKNLGARMTMLVISNDEIQDIIKTGESLE